MNYFEVAPLIYIGEENNVLTYSSADNLKPGTAVLVPLRNKEIVGVITKKVEKPSFIAKDILKTIYDQPILDNNHLRLAFWISDYYGASLVSVLQNMIPSGITKKRRPIYKEEKIQTSEKLQLTEEQEKIFKEIMNNFSSKPHLIFGVTGSGKTEIYMQLIEKVRLENKQVIVLVPEIALTPQTLKRFEERFGNDVALLHSRLKETERFANWKAILDGQKNIVVGSRSAIFSPCKNLGLIIIDEEHENSYKQDKTPRYQTVNVAKKLAKFYKAGLVLGSATPSILTFHEASTNNIFLHTLNNRIVQTNLPKVEIVDMRNEFKFGNKSILSEKLQFEIQQTLDKKLQVMLFLNRRGMSTFVSCRDCGHVEICPNCNISLTFHFDNLKLKCHHCDYQKQAPVSCPECKSSAIKYFGTGTQKVESELKKFFGDKYKISRMDADTTKIRGSHEEIYNNFADNNSDILIGTQMIAKGWDLGNVGLVGVISADTILNFPDFTSAERTFSLLTQVAGRTGRGKDEGKVIIQTYTPDHLAIKLAAKHDYSSFYEEEIKNREELNYPPFAKLIKLLYNNKDIEVAKSESQRIKSELEQEFAKENISATLLGPSPAFIPKINNSYYYQLVIKIELAPEKKLIHIMSLIEKITNKKWSIDIDPSDLL